MYARNVSFRLKSNMQSDYASTFENQILPLLRKQIGLPRQAFLHVLSRAYLINISCEQGHVRSGPWHRGKPSRSCEREIELKEQPTPSAS